jgi:hypothetical protein
MMLHSQVLYLDVKVLGQTKNLPQGQVSNRQVEHYPWRRFGIKIKKVLCKYIFMLVILV